MRTMFASNVDPLAENRGEVLGIDRAKVANSDATPMQVPEGPRHGESTRVGGPKVLPIPPQRSCQTPQQISCNRLEEESENKAKLA